MWRQTKHHELNRRPLNAGECLETRVRSILAGIGDRPNLVRSFFKDLVKLSGINIYCLISTTTQYAYASGSGVAGFIAVGKEWWVSANWGLGVALFACYGSAGDGSTRGQIMNAGPMSSFEAVVLFSATYN